MFTPAFHRYVRPARSHAQLWRFVVGLVLIAFVYLAGLAAIFALIWATTGRPGVRTWVERVTEAQTPTGTMLLLFSFLGMALGPMVAARNLHRRPIGTLFGPLRRLRGDFLVAGLAVIGVYLALTLAWSFFFDAVPNLDPFLWMSYLPLALIGVALQTGAEELVFRGYMQQQLAARFRSPLVWMLLPSLCFGAVHYDTQAAGSNAWLVAASATAFGLAAADLTRVTGNIGAAWGFHFANNVMAMLFIAVAGTIPGLALYVTPYSVDDTAQLPALIFVDFLAVLAAWAILRRLLRR